MCNVTIYSYLKLIHPALALVLLRILYQNFHMVINKTFNQPVAKLTTPPPPSASLPPSVTRGDVTDIQPMAAAQTPACTALASVMEVCVCVWEQGCGKIN